MKKVSIMILALGLLLTPMQSAQAYFESSSWTESESYLGKTGGKFMFGAKNLVLGWWDVLYEPHRFSNEGSWALLGVFKGLIDTPFNMIEGALHLLTFPIPFDVPLPDGGVGFAAIEANESASDYKINQYASDHA